MHAGGHGCPVMQRPDVQMEEVGADLSNFWCHQCGKEILPEPGPRCPGCKGDFIEEMAPPPTAPAPAPARPNPRRGASFGIRFGGGPAQEPFFQVFHQPLFVGHAQPTDESTQIPPFPFPFNPFFGRAPTASYGIEEPPMELLALQNFLSELLGSDSPLIPPSEAGFGGGGNWEQLLNRLFEQSSGRQGPPPASKAAVSSLPTVMMTVEEVAKKEECAICKDAFELSDQVQRLPCRHQYHKQCISPWLDAHNTCPVCRFELPTDDAEYEARRQRAAAQRQCPSNRPT